MCGICGVFALDGRLDPRLGRACAAMNGAIAHRGPDGDGFFDDGLASRSATAAWRSSIAPAASSRWPTKTAPAGSSSTARSTTTASSGPCSRREATASAPSSDTEAILHAYEEYGPACVDRLEGMFAFAIYDEPAARAVRRARPARQEAVLLRACSTACFTSRASCRRLRASPAWNGELDLTALEGYLSLGYFLAPAHRSTATSTS